MTLSAIKDDIRENTGVMLYFQAKMCNLCKVLKPKLFKAVEKEFPKIRCIVIDADKFADIAAYFSIFSMPSVIVFLDGKEFVRTGRNISIPVFIERLRRPYDILISQ